MILCLWSSRSTDSGLHAQGINRQVFQRHASLVQQACCGNEYSWMQQQDQADVEINVLLQHLADEHCTAFAVDTLQSRALWGCWNGCDTQYRNWPSFAALTVYVCCTAVSVKLLQLSASTVTVCSSVAIWKIQIMPCVCNLQLSMSPCDSLLKVSVTAKWSVLLINLKAWWLDLQCKKLQCHLDFVWMHACHNYVNASACTKISQTSAKSSDINKSRSA